MAEKRDSIMQDHRAVVHAIGFRLLHIRPVRHSQSIVDAPQSIVDAPQSIVDARRLETSSAQLNRGEMTHHDPLTIDHEQSVIHIRPTFAC